MSVERASRESAEPAPPERPAAPAGPAPPAVARLLALQRSVGNAVVARALGAAQAEDIADEVFEGVDGWGTDEDRIFRAMRPVTAADIPQLSATYRARHGSDLVGDLRDDLSDDELQANIVALRRTGPDATAFELQEAMEGAGTDEERIYRALSGVGAAELPAIETAYRARTGRDLRADLVDELTTGEFRRLPVYQAIGLDAVAQQVHDAVEGAGTDENAVFGALAGRTQPVIDQIAAAYLRMYGRAMIDDLRDDLSDGEMARLATLSPAFAPAGAAGPDPGAATAVAAQLDDAMSGLGTNEEAIFSALSNRSAEELVAIKAAYRALTGDELEADLRDELSGDDLQRALAQLGIAQTVTETETELGGLIFGNFDFVFSGGAVVITVRLKFEFRSDVPEAERDPFKQRFLSAAAATWQHPPMGLHAEGPAPVADVSITINPVEDEGNPHKVVDVTDEARREHVIDEVNVSKHTDNTTIAHEFGHVLGLCDEYDGGLENLMFWHENRADDPTGIMNQGTEYRARYFENLRQRVQATAPPGVVYHVVRTR
jgi:annexin A7/11